jgi:hypothetical protein
VAELGYVGRRTSTAVLRGFVSLRRSALCDLESLRVDRAFGRRGQEWKAGLAILDEACGGDCGADGWNRLHVHTMQTVLKSLLEVEGKKQVGSFQNLQRLPLTLRLFPEFC